MPPTSPTTEQPGPSRPRRFAQEHGEGVVSVAIAVLIIAFLGVALYVAFSGVLDGMTDEVEGQIQQIGEG